jgi:hypothetical protein
MFFTYRNYIISYFVLFVKHYFLTF